MIKTYFKRNAILLIASILLLAVGLWLDVQWLSHRPATLLYLINLLPGLLLLLTWFLASRSPNRRWLCIGLGLLTTLFALIVVSHANLGAVMVVSATTPIRDTARYEEILMKYEEKLTAHFPRHIPDSATNVTFSTVHFH